MSSEVRGGVPEFTQQKHTADSHGEACLVGLVSFGVIVTLFDQGQRPMWVVALFIALAG